jgi:hypothetical protein
MIEGNFSSVGLVLGTFITEWKRLVPSGGLKLSQLLAMYYSEDGAFEPRYRACQRKDLYSLVAPNDKLEEQVSSCLGDKLEEQISSCFGLPL